MHRVDMDFEGANDSIITSTEIEIDGNQNFYYAHCPKGITNLKQYCKIIYKNIYKNIDVNYYGDNQNGIKYDIVVQPHGDLNQIKLHWKYAESMHINKEGNLVIKTSVNEFYESMPKVYQLINGEVIDVKAKYELTLYQSERSETEGGKSGEGIVTFKLSNYQSEYPLIIDPWVTYFGGTGDEYADSAANDLSGNVYTAGYTSSLAGIAAGGAQNIYGGGSNDAFLAKFSETGVLLWASYYGGMGWDWANSVATDAVGICLYCS